MQQSKMLNLNKIKYEAFSMKLLFPLVFLTTILGLFGQKQEKVDFLRAEVYITPEPKEKTVHGKVTYEFVVLKPTNSIFLDAKQMDFSLVLLNDKKKKFTHTDSTISISHKFKKGKTYFITLHYKATPKKAVYFMGWDGKASANQIWTQGQGKYTSNWLPSFDDMTEKVEFDLNVVLDKKYTAIANGALVNTLNKEDGTRTWSYNMEQPMSSYLVAFVIGAYAKTSTFSESGIPLEFYFYPKDSLKVEATFRHSKKIFNFLEQEIGVAYPWLNYKQIPVKDFLYAGMENTGTTIFSDHYMIDSTAFIDRNYVNINAHELAHQWFGNLITEKDGNSHWLHEGFATYYAYLAEKEVFGNNYYYWKLYDSAQNLKEQTLVNKGEALINPKASSLTFYEKGAWALEILREEIGSKAFTQGVANYLEKYAYKNVAVKDFILELEKVSGKSLDSFQETWLRSTVFPYEDVKKHLASKSIDIRNFIALQDQIQVSGNSYLEKENTIKKYWDNSNSETFKSNIIRIYYPFLSDGFKLKALKNEGLKVRQAIVKQTTTVSDTLKSSLETLLTDKSYVTQENALYALWSSYPKERGNYLDQTKDVLGLPNKNIRLLWLTLAMVTPEYKSLQTEKYYNELVGYTSSDFSTEIRRGAFQFLHQTIGLNNQSLKNLLKATNHPSWQFKKFARNLLSELITDKDIKNRIKQLSSTLKNKEMIFINTLLN